MAPRQNPISTERLVLRSFVSEDAERLCALAGSRDVSDTMISIPYPFTRTMAEDAIRQYERDFSAGTAAHFAVTDTTNVYHLLGYAAIKHVDREHLEGELSFWIDPRRSGLGFATEAGRAVLDYGFDVLGLNRICAITWSGMARRDACSSAWACHWKDVYAHGSENGVSSRMCSFGRRCATAGFLTADATLGLSIAAVARSSAQRCSSNQDPVVSPRPL